MYENMEESLFNQHKQWLIQMHDKYNEKILIKVNEGITNAEEIARKEWLMANMIPITQRQPGHRRTPSGHTEGGVMITFNHTT